MNRLRTGRGQTFVGLALTLLVLVALAFTAGRGTQQLPLNIARAEFHDATPLGGKGVRLLMERLGFSVKRETSRLSAMPPDASVWLILSPSTRFSEPEAASLLTWVRSGNTLVLAVPPQSFSDFFGESNTGLKTLCARLGVVQPDFSSVLSNVSQSTQTPPLPDLFPLPRGAASDYWSGVSTAVGSKGQLNLATKTPDDVTNSLEIAGNPVGSVLLRRQVGRGRVILAPDALMFSNYALSKPDNAVLVSNLLRVGVPAGSTIYFDERAHGDLRTSEEPDNILRYLRLPAVRATILQLLFMGVLLWILFGTRLGAPVPLREHEPVTRASNFARAMGALFHGSGRSEASAQILGAEFRRLVSRRVGLNPQDAPELIAERVSQVADVPLPLVLRLLKRADFSPSETGGHFLEAAPRAVERLTTGGPEARDEAELLRDAQEMEDVLRKLGVKR